MTTQNEVRTYEDFINVATREFVSQAQNGYRYGQALFNVLLTHKPELAERVRSTDIDPFYEDTLAVDCVIGNFLLWVSENWSTS